MQRSLVGSEMCIRDSFTVDYTGFGWVLIKKGVFENLEYPWFAPKMQVFESGSVQDMCGEDVSFCLDAKEKGYDIWCDPRIRVGHEKTRQGSSQHTLYAASSRNKAKKAYRGQGK